MQLKSSAAMAAVVALAASANAIEMSKGITVQTGVSVVPSVSAVDTSGLNTSIPQLSVLKVDAGIGAINAISQVPGAQQSPVAALAADQRLQVITAQDVKSQDAKPGALNAYFDNGSSKMKPESTVVAGANGSGLAPLAPASAHVAVTPASMGLSRIAYGSFNAANGGMVWDAVKRIGRAIGSMFSIFSKKVNTPELSAEAYMAKLKTEGEQLQKLVAGAAKTVSLLRIQVKNEQTKIDELSTKRDAALKAGRDDVAAMYDGQLSPLEATHTTNVGQLSSAEQSLSNAKETLASFVQRRESEYARIQAKLGQVNAAKAKAQLDGLKNTMRTGQIAEKDEFDRATDDAIATAEGESEASKATGQDQMEDFERDMEKAKAKERLEQRKKELGLGGSTESGDKK